MNPFADLVPGNKGRPSDDDVFNFIVDTAPKYGIPVEDALDVWAGEGKGAWQSNFKKRGIREPSYGPYQLLVGGPGTGFPRGLGNAFMEETGRDPSDPANWKEAAEYALKTASKEGWGQWYGAPSRLRGKKYKPMALGSADSAPANPFLDLVPKQEDKVEAAVAQEAQEAAPPPEPTPWGDIGEDAMRGTIAGGISGIATTIGLPGSVVEGVDYMAKQFGYDTDNPIMNALKDYLPTIDEVHEYQTPLGKAADAASYVPKTGAGEAAQSVAQIAGGGPLMGRTQGFLTRSMPKKVAEVLGAGVAADAGEKIGGPVGGFVGAVAASHQLGKPIAAQGQPRVTRADRAAAEADMVHSPQTEGFRRRSRGLYDRLDGMGVVIPPNQHMNFWRNMLQGDELASLEYNPQQYTRLARMFNQTLDHMTPMTGPQGPGMTFRRFDDTRQQFSKIARTSADPKERMIAGHVVDRMDQFFDEATQGLTGNAAATARQARNQWRMYRKSEEVDVMAENIKEKAAQYTQSGDENAVRTTFRQLSTKINKDPRARARFTQDEIRFIRKLSRGESVQKALRDIGGILGNRLFQGGAALGGIYAGGDPTSHFMSAVGAVLTGRAAKGGANILAKRNLNRYGNLVRSGGQMTPPTHPLAAGLMALNPYLGQ